LLICLFVYLFILFFCFMERIDINLLPTAARFQLSRLKAAKKFKKAAYFSVAAWIILMLIVFLLRVVLAQQTAKIALEKTRAEQLLNSLSPQTDLQQALRWRLKLAGEVLTARPKVGEKISALVAAFPEGSVIKTLRIKGDKTEVSGFLPGLIGLSEFERRISVLVDEGKYSSVKIKSLAKKEANFDFLVEFQEMKK
jgi:Tfp pilus assembly protein PilN